MPGVLVDTDVAIDFLRGLPYAQPLMAALWAEGYAVLSVLSVYELTAGMRNAEKISTNNFIDASVIEAVTVEIAFKGGELYRSYRAQGITLTSLDCLIAATALVRGYKVATRNDKHYPEKEILFAMETLAA
ncbi:MAG: PIN domain-containing protein [Desulfuromonadales bacterium]